MSAVGDPGLFSFIGKGISAIGKAIVPTIGGFLTGGPAGAILGAAGSVGILGGGAPKSVGMAKANVSLANLGGRTPGMFPAPLPQAPSFSGAKIGPGGVAVGTSYYAPTAGAPQAAIAAGPGKACPAGYHLNKAAYMSRSGMVAKGTVCVKNRRRNPLNPRALSRSMSRLKSAQRAVRCLGLFAGAPARAVKASSNGRFRKKSGCKSCR